MSYLKKSQTSSHLIESVSFVIREIPILRMILLTHGIHCVRITEILWVLMYIDVSVIDVWVERYRTLGRVKPSEFEYRILNICILNTLTI